MSECVFRQDGFVFAVQESGEKATIAWKGVGDDRLPRQFLGPLIEQWGQKLKDSEVTVDLRQLEYMNSAMVMQLISLVKRLDANGKPVVVMFLNVEWQRVHGSCMAAIARTLENVRVEHQLLP
jgi:anti-anti-sigma regulatory factor